MGKTHAKWSPVATAWYRMLPEVFLYVALFLFPLFLRIGILGSDTFENVFVDICLVDVF